MDTTLYLLACQVTVTVGNSGLYLLLCLCDIFQALQWIHRELGPCVLFIKTKTKQKLKPRLDRWFVCFSPDTFRVIGEDAVELHERFEPRPYRASFEPPTPEERLFPDIDCRRTRVLPKPTADFRAHKPQSKSCSFITTDVRLLNEPVCTVSWFSN